MQASIQDFNSVTKLDREGSVDALLNSRLKKNQIARRRILLERRLDVLCRYILDYEVLPLHYAMIQFQEDHPHSLQLGFRGCGKTQMLLINRIVLELLLNPNLRILIGSKTQRQAETFLRGIKKVFTNEKFISVFGNLKSDDKWETAEINIQGRTSTAMESNVSTIGAEGSIVSRHFDMIFLDDLVSEDNSRTRLQREKIHTWYYKELYPCLEPGRTRLHILGTRYHHKDLYGHLLANEMKGHTQIVPALDKLGRSPWPEKFSEEELGERRRQAGVVIFNSQYLCDTGAMESAIFQPDYFQHYVDPPADLRIFQAIDPAISEKTRADFFASVTVGIDEKGDIYVLAYSQKHLRFRPQVDAIYQGLVEWRPLRLGVESNAYQQALYQELRDNPDTRDFNILPIFNTVDKKTRAWRLASRYEAGKIYHPPGAADLEEHLLSFPDGEHDDLFDALEMAIRLGTEIRIRKRREVEPGLI